MVVVVPLPVADPEGVPVMDHVPDAGNPLSTTEPVGVVQSGCVTVPMSGAVGVVGCALITADKEAEDVHPRSFVTVKV